jgi:psiF repeat
MEHAPGPRAGVPFQELLEQGLHAHSRRSARMSAPTGRWERSDREEDAQAGDEKGDERKAFMSNCLKAGDWLKGGQEVVADSPTAGVSSTRLAVRPL